MTDLKKNTYVDREIARAVLELQTHEPNTKEYGEMLDRLTKLQKIRQEEKPKTASPDSVLAAAANLLGIAIIVQHEHFHVITSKAMSFVSRLR